MIIPSAPAGWRSRRHGGSASPVRADSLHPMAKRGDDHADQIDDGHGDSHDDGQAAHGRRTTRADAPATVEPGRSGVPTKWSIDRLDIREKQFTYVAAGASAVFAILVYADETSKHHLKLAKNQLSPQTTLVIGLVAAVLLVIAALVGRRAPVGFVALFTGAAFGGSSIVLGLPFFVLAIWVLYHAYKNQKETSASLRAARSEAGAAPPARSRTAPPPKGSSPSARKRAKGPVTPTANKRYTPKTPPRPAPPAPKPSRRERRQSAASD